jgi:tetratricopeptide (TPR) repeat protein
MARKDAGEVRNTISGGIQHGPVLQARDIVNPTFVTNQAAAAPVALAQLPPLAAGFTGRDDELAQFAALLNPAGEAGAVVVSAVAGLAGVGKTALAVQAAHAARSSGWFPGGVLFIDLHGYDENLVQAGQALDALLRALGIRGEDVPEGMEARSGLYRSELAQIIEPVLIVADNASTETQVRPLLPGPGPHRVIITSRHTLAGLGARLLDVTVLDPAAAMKLLDRVLRAARPADDRIRGDPDAAGRLAQVCGGLPLALQITAALLAADPPLTAAELAGELADEVRRLETLRYDDGSGIAAPSVAAAFELSYRELDQDAALLFRLMPADPGPDISTEAAAALTGCQPRQARAVLGRLAKAHLVESSASAPGRWRMHDLLRLYARQIPGTVSGERAEAVDRLLAWYLRQAGAADAHLRALPGTAVPAEFADRDVALAWLDAQRLNLIAAVVMASESGRDETAIMLPLSLVNYLLWRRRLDELLMTVSMSRDSARRRGSRRDEARALTCLGLALWETRRFDDAASAHRNAVALFSDVGDRHSEGVALNNLGNALREENRCEEAIQAHESAAAIFEEAGDRRSEGMALNNLGVALQKAGQLDEAIDAHQAAAVIYRNIADKNHLGTALGNLGAVWMTMRKFAEAIGASRDALAIFRETGDLQSEATALHNLGVALREMGQFEEAIDCYERDIAVCRETGDQYGESQALYDLGLTYREMKQPGRAAEHWQKAAAIMADVGNQKESARLEQLAITAEIV